MPRKRADPDSLTPPAAESQPFELRTFVAAARRLLQLIDANAVDGVLDLRIAYQLDGAPVEREYLCAPAIRQAASELEAAVLGAPPDFQQRLARPALAFARAVRQEGAVAVTRLTEIREGLANSVERAEALAGSTNERPTDDLPGALVRRNDREIWKNAAPRCGYPSSDALRKAARRAAERGERTALARIWTGRGGSGGPRRVDVDRYAASLARGTNLAPP